MCLSRGTVCRRSLLLLLTCLLLCLLRLLSFLSHVALHDPKVGSMQVDLDMHKYRVHHNCKIDTARFEEGKRRSHRGALRVSALQSAFTPKGSDSIWRRGMRTTAKPNGNFTTFGSTFTLKRAAIHLLYREATVPGNPVGPPDCILLAPGRRCPPELQRGWRRTRNRPHDKDPLREDQT